MVIGEDEEGTLNAEQLVMGVGRLKGAARTGPVPRCRCDSCDPSMLNEQWKLPTLETNAWFAVYLLKHGDSWLPG